VWPQHLRTNLPTATRSLETMEGTLAGEACPQPSRTWAARKAIRAESRREQQFYRFARPSIDTTCTVLIFSSYYGPFRQMSNRGPVYCDVRDPQAREQHEPTSCPDKILTAFCQLGALRMKARRCLIFFFDVNHAYIMAEATKTLSLENDATHDPGDQLWSKSCDRTPRRWRSPSRVIRYDLFPC
jgi:hypothetical protein